MAQCHDNAKAHRRRAKKHAEACRLQHPKQPRVRSGSKRMRPEEAAAMRKKVRAAAAVRQAEKRERRFAKKAAAGERSVRCAQRREEDGFRARSRETEAFRDQW